MFNLIVKYSNWAEGRDSTPLVRALEYTEDDLVERFKPDGQLDLDALKALPTLFVQESSGQGTELARVGTIQRARVSGNSISLEYSYDLGIQPIPNSVLETLAPDLRLPILSSCERIGQ